MDFSSFVEGPLLWIVCLIFIGGIIIRLAFFFYAIKKSVKYGHSKWRYLLPTFGRLFFPFHKAVVKRPIYATLRYVFHLCMMVIPIWLSGHIVLWEESRFEWYWAAIPDAWADWLTILLLCLAAYFLIRRVVLPDIRLNSSTSDYFLIVITSLPFITGYFLTHGSLDSMAFLGNNMQVIHVLSGEAMLLTAVFLFCKTRLRVEKCTGCAACELSCPTETLESKDKGALRVFTYSHYQCICCGACVNTCPETAAELRHEISPKGFFRIVPKQPIQSVQLAACERCGAMCAPELQLKKISQTYRDEYIHFCPTCRMANMRDLYYKLSPSHNKFRKIGHADLATHH